MKKIVYLIVLVLIITGITACASENRSTTEPQTTSIASENTGEQEVQNEQSQNEIPQMKIQIGEYIFYASLENNTSVDALIQMMKETPIVINMRDYSGFEKVGSLGTTLPDSNSQITTQAGDIVLYNKDQIVVFYDSNSWSYTKIGHVNDLTDWEKALGNGDVEITFSID